mmetsp:Transcript_25181/g.57429  ORF Transcript_25181/g.57429 Transcript_25181/m.57429 type:complete len:205 (+) Transcript_25181:579-1193(+)
MGFAAAWAAAAPGGACSPTPAVPGPSSRSFLESTPAPWTMEASFFPFLYHQFLTESSVRPTTLATSLQLNPIDAMTDWAVRASPSDHGPSRWTKPPPAYDGITGGSIVGPFCFLGGGGPPSAPMASPRLLTRAYLIRSRRAWDVFSRARSSPTSLHRPVAGSWTRNRPGGSWSRQRRTTSRAMAGFWGRRAVVYRGLYVSVRER